jgi:hypothetical protein
MKKVYLLFLLLLGATSWAAPNRYSLVTLENLSRFRVHYTYRWGEGEKLWHNSIAPYGKYTHWWDFRYPNENWAPWFYLNFDSGDNWHKLGSYYSPNKNSSNGRHYFIEAVEDRKGIYNFEVTEELQLY